MSTHTTSVPGRGDNSLLERLCASWVDRAAVRNPDYHDGLGERFIPELYDFPPGLLPFKNHPAYLALDEPVHRRVQSLAWLAWNRRVVDTEELVVCKALIALMSGGTDIRLTGASRSAIRYTFLDEAFHSHMHEVAIGVIVRERGLPLELVDQLRRPGYSYRSLLAATKDMSERWETDIAHLTWAVVGELSIYEFLTIVSSDESIQPGSRELLTLHERDEAAHASIVAQVLREHFHALGRAQRACFVSCLPHAMTSLSQQDWAVWRDVLELAGVEKAAAIVADTEHDADVPNQLPLLRSYRRITSLCEELDIELPESHHGS